MIIWLGRFMAKVSLGYSAPAAGSFLIQQNGSYILQQSGFKISIRE